jgi:hypothetical protein
VSITDHIPGLRGTGSRRAVDKVGELEALVADLRDENIHLHNRQAAADDFIAQLMHDVTTTNAALEAQKQCRALADHAVAQMDKARNDWRDEALKLRAQLANATRITVPCGIRDTTAIEDQATVPVPVITPVLPLHDAPFATNPGRN